MMLSDKTVIVVGVGAGLGFEVAHVAIADGANVVLGARTEKTLLDAAAKLDPTGKRVAHVTTDIVDPSQCEALVASAVENFGGVDALIIVAAYEAVFGGLHETNLEDWRRAWETNVIGAMTLLRAVTPEMKKRGGGSVVLIGSQSMFKASLPQAGYAATKGGLLSAMYYLADELGPDNIRINMVIPSWMWGPPVEGFVAAQAKSKGISQEEALAEIVSEFPLRRMTEDGEVADATIFFASDRAKAITGQHLMVNSGELMR